VKSAKAVFEKAGKAKGDAKAKEIAAGSFTKLCDEKGEFKPVVEGLGQVKLMLTHAVGDAAAVGIERMKTMSGILKGADFASKDALYGSIQDDTISQMVSTADDYIKAAGTDQTHDDGLGLAKLGPIMFGGHAVISYVVKPDWKNDPKVKEAGMDKSKLWEFIAWLAAKGVTNVVDVGTLNIFHGPTKAKFDKVPVASTEDCKAIAKAAEEIGALVVGFKTKNDQVQVATKELQVAGDAFAKKADAAKELGDEGLKACKAILKTVQHVARGSSNFAKTGISYGISVTATALSYAEKSLAQYAAE
jgi:hypothetical protein